MLLAKILEIFVSEVEGITDVIGILPSLIVQPVTKPVISYFSKNGGNALGIVESDGPLIRTSQLSLPNSICPAYRVNSHSAFIHVVIRW